MKKTLSIKFPIENSNEGHYFNMNTTTIDSEISKLKFFLTVGGGLIFNPNYGINLNKYLFEQFDSLTFKSIEEEIKQKLNQYFPQIEIDKITFIINENNSVINFNFDIIIFNQKSSFLLN